MKDIRIHEIEAGVYRCQLKMPGYKRVTAFAETAEKAEKKAMRMYKRYPERAGDLNTPL